MKLLLEALKASSGNSIKVVHCHTIPSAFIAVTFFLSIFLHIFQPKTKHQENVFSIYCVESAGPAGITVLLKQGFFLYADGDVGSLTVFHKCFPFLFNDVVNKTQA